MNKNRIAVIVIFVRMKAPPSIAKSQLIYIYEF